VPTETAEPSPTATEDPALTPDPERTFSAASRDPIIETGSRYTDPGAVVVVDGVFHLFANVFAAWPARVDVYHYTSPDGLVWEKVGGSPVFNEENVPYIEVAVLANSVMVEDDGTWVLYFSTWNGTNGFAESEVGRATSPGPDGPWTPDAEPVLRLGSAGAWDEQQANQPSVIRTDDGYVMYYGGHADDLGAAIGMATSPDGIVWTKYNDPTTNDPRFAESDPVFRADGSGWDAALVWQPNVVQTDSGLVMLYKGAASVSTGQFEHGVAVSEDGVHWKQPFVGPSFSAVDTPGGMHIWYTNLAYVDGEYFLFYELAKDANSGRTKVYVALGNMPIPAP
jgi:predicted GH43/DUF377 family glycosyl hydrolase